MSILKERWLFHVVHGEFYEAYHMYRDNIEPVNVQLVCVKPAAAIVVASHLRVVICSGTPRLRNLQKTQGY